MPTVNKGTIRAFITIQEMEVGNMVTIGLPGMAAVCEVGEQMVGQSTKDDRADRTFITVVREKSPTGFTVEVLSEVAEVK